MRPRASLPVRRSRSVGHTGNQTETTRPITALQFHLEAFARPRPDQLDEPARPPHARHRQGRGGQRGDPPARHRRRGLAKVRGLCRTPPAPEREAQRAALAGGQVQPARDGHRETGRFRHNGRKPAIPQPLLHAAEHGCLVPRLDMDHPVRMQTRLRQPRRLTHHQDQRPVALGQLRVPVGLAPPRPPEREPLREVAERRHRPCLSPPAAGRPRPRGRAAGAGGR